jgi:hypothetical protein
MGAPSDPASTETNIRSKLVCVEYSSNPRFLIRLTDGVTQRSFFEWTYLENAMSHVPSDFSLHRRLLKRIFENTPGMAANEL